MTDADVMSGIAVWLIIAAAVAGLHVAVSARAWLAKARFGIDGEDPAFDAGETPSQSRTP